MNAKQFRQIIQTIIKEEVQKEVSKQLPKLLFEMLGQQSKTVVRESTIPQKPMVVTRQPILRNQADDPEEGLLTPQQPKKVIKRYAKDPKLNAVLNETTPGLPQTPYYDGGVPLPNFEKIGGVSEEFIGEMKEIINESVTPQSPITEEVVEEVPSNGPDLSKLFNKNFKAILDKSKQKTGGNFSNVLQNW